MDAPGNRLGWWDGTLWNQVGGVDPKVVGAEPSVNTMLVWDDGSGPALFVGGQFRTLGEQVVRYIARWDGAAWSDLGGGLINDPIATAVRAMVVYDDGSGPSLYAGGRFKQSWDKRSLLGIARWDGKAWQEVGGGVYFSPGEIGTWGVHSLAVFDDGEGAALYVGGLFNLAGPISVNGFAKWDGKGWSAPGQPLLQAPKCIGGDDCIPRVNTMVAFDDGTGEALYAGGNFQAPGASPWIARFRHGQWESAGQIYGHLKNNKNGVTEIDMLSVVDIGKGPELYLGGRFMTYDPPPGDNAGGSLARWDGATQSWVDLDANPSVKAVTAFDDGRGTRLWVGGPFFSAGTKTPGSASTLGMRTDEGWEHLPWRSLSSGPTRSLLAFDDGSGPAIYHTPNSADSTEEFPIGSPGLSRLTSDGWAGWGSIGDWRDIHPEIVNSQILCQDLADLGQGNRLYVYGWFYRVDGQPKALVGIACWDGVHWSQVGQDISGLSTVERIFAYDDGNGPALYFATHGSKTDLYKLEDDEWTLWAHGKGAGFGIGGVYAALEFDDGTGRALWIGGDVGEMEGVAVQGIARYRPQTGWEAVGTGMDGWVSDLVVWDSGNGPTLYASGQFTKGGGRKVNHVARWDGKAQEWRALGSGLNGNANLTVWDDGTGVALWANGAFDTAGGKPIDRIAKWDGKDWSGLEGIAPNGGVSWIAGADLGMGPTVYMMGAFTHANNYNSGGFAAYHFCPPVPCAADLDGSGTLDLFDFLLFVNLFNSGDAAADCDANGALDLLDFSCFAEAFGQGC